MPKYGYLANPSEEVLKEIRKAKRLGMDYVEIAIEGPEGMPAILLRKKKKILDLLKEKKLFAIGHTAWWMELASPYEEIREMWVEEAKKAVDVAQALEINLLNFHFNLPYSIYMTKPATKKQILDTFVKTMKELVRYGKPRNVNIMLENTPIRKEVASFQDYAYVIDKTPALGAHFDVGHAFKTGGMKYIVDYIHKFGKDMLHVHVSDNDGEHDLHQPIGEGSIDWESVVRLLKEAGYDRTITLEVFTEGKYVKASRIRFQKLWERIE